MPRIGVLEKNDLGYKFEFLDHYLYLSLRPKTYFFS